MRGSLRIIRPWGILLAEGPGPTVTVTGKHRDGSELRIPDVPLEGLLAWAQGDYIQDALPGLTPDQRESLISGTSPAEFARLFGEDEP